MRFDYFYEDHSRLLQEFPFIFHRNMTHMGLRKNKEGAHCHENVEMIYIVKGNGIIYCDQDTVSVSVGDFFLVPSNAVHSVSPYTEDAPVVFHCLIIDKLFHDALLLPMTSRKFQRLIHDERIQQIFEMLAEEYEKKSPYWQLEFKNLIGHLLVYLFRTYLLSEDPLLEIDDKKRAIVGQIIRYLCNHLREDLSVDLLSSKMGFNKCYLCHVFKEVTGSTITEYYNTLRCQYAYQLLTSGQYTVQEVSEKSGFHNLSYFSRTYLRYRGISPSADRKAALALRKSL